MVPKSMLKNDDFRGREKGSFLVSPCSRCSPVSVGKVTENGQKWTQKVTHFGVVFWPLLDHFWKPLLSDSWGVLVWFSKTSRGPFLTILDPKMTPFWPFLTLFGSFFDPFFDPLLALIRRFYLILLTSRCLKKGSKMGHFWPFWGCFWPLFWPTFPNFSSHKTTVLPKNGQKNVSKKWSKSGQNDHFWTPCFQNQ